MARFYVYDGSKYVPAGADGKSAYQYAQEGGYTGTEEEFAEKLAQEQLDGTTLTLTPTQVYDAVSVGIPVTVHYFDGTYGSISFTVFNAKSSNVIVSQRIISANGEYILAELIGNKPNGTWSFMTAPLQLSSITDTGGYYTTDTVEGALQEIGAGLAGAVKSVNGKTGVVTLNATEIPSTKLAPTNVLNFVIDGAFDEANVELTRNGASASANDFISAINSGSTVTVGLNDQGNPKVSFDTQPVKYKITNDTLSLCFIAEKGHTYTPAIYVLSGPTSGTGVSNLVEHRFTDSLYQENYVSANDLPVQAPLTVEEYLEELESRIAALQSKSITDSGGHFTTDTVEGALQEIGAELAGINTLLGSGIQISFTIEDAHCTANAGQMFFEWVGSGYKTIENGMVLSVHPYGDEGVIFLDEAGVYALSLDGNTPVRGGDRIISGAAYVAMNWGG